VDRCLLNKKTEIRGYNAYWVYSVEANGVLQRYITSLRQTG